MSPKSKIYPLKIKSKITKTYGSSRLLNVYYDSVNHLCGLRSE